MRALDNTAGTAVTRFDGTAYAFLSNFYKQEVVYEDITYPTSERAYQAAKTTDRKIRLRIAALETTAKAKKMGNSITKRQGWDRMRRSVLLRIVRIKFQDPVMAGWMLATGDAELVEGNTWGDTYWGQCGNLGHNWLGKILMRVRNELRMALKEAA